MNTILRAKEIEPTNALLYSSAMFTVLFTSIVDEPIVDEQRVRTFPLYWCLGRISLKVADAVLWGDE